MSASSSRSASIATCDGPLGVINKGEGGFVDRDLYPFCSNISDGKNVALGNPNAKQLLAWTLGPQRTSTVRPLARNSGTPIRSRKVKLLRLATCL
jgi:hypothetical protein